MPNWCCAASDGCCSCRIPPSLGLLSPLEFLVTVNHSALWQKHVAWAMPNGDKLRQYITSRYASNMVLLSLLLAAEINVFFNSSRELAELRSTLGSTTLVVTACSSLKFWIGLTILLDVCVTVMGLVAIFTLWGMISAISDTNAHCLLRSSLGEYVIALPPRLVVASLYLFLTWIILFVIDILAAPLSWLVVLLVFIMFFAIIIPLSAFGRLILHTGAMSQKPILRQELETQLLPSGLQASLLLRATHRQRRNQAVTTQYQRMPFGPDAMSNNIRPVQTTSGTGASHGDSSNDQEEMQQQETRAVPRMSNDAASHEEEAQHSFSPPLPQQTSPPSRMLQHHTYRRHQRIESFDTMASEFPFPQASILNSTISGKELFELMATTLPASSSTPSTATRKPTPTTAATQGSKDDMRNQESYPPPRSPLHSQNNGMPPTHPQRAKKHHRRASSTRVLMEWNEDADVRDLYGASMPVVPHEIDLVPNVNSPNDSFRWSPWSKSSSPFLSSFSNFALDNDEETPLAAPCQDGSVTDRLSQPLLLHDHVDTIEGGSAGSSLQGEDLLSPEKSEPHNKT